MSNELKAPEWMDRCDDCGWPYAEDRSKGCAAFDCSFRPQHGSADYKRWKAGQSLTFTERKLTRDYIRRLETRVRLGTAEITRLHNALIGFGSHEVDCPEPVKPCDCGFSDALATVFRWESPLATCPDCGDQSLTPDGMCVSEHCEPDEKGQ